MGVPFPFPFCALFAFIPFFATFTWTGRIAELLCGDGNGGHVARKRLGLLSEVLFDILWMIVIAFF
jgi:hypothetical protein